MGKLLIVANEEHLQGCKAIMGTYDVGIEIDDFFYPVILDSKEKTEHLIRCYEDLGIPEGSTMHGAFFDVVLFSCDSKVREVSQLRMKQSMDIAMRLGVKGVVFHTNCNPMLTSKEYSGKVVDMTVEYLQQLLEKYPQQEIYMENMFDATPQILVGISERLCAYRNYGVCLDYAHACLYGRSVEEWVKALAPFVKHIHINDNDMKNDLHLALGDGVINWDEFVSYRQRYFKESSILIETTLPENQRKSLEFLERNYEGMVERR